MTFADIVILLTALFQFPATILAFVKILKASPQEKHEDILKKLREEAQHFDESGRPTW